MRTAISAAIINENKELLLVNKRGTRILPWWKPDEEEGELDCLEREVDEELNWAKLENIQYYNSVIWTTPHKGDLLEAKVYIADLMTENLCASAELSEAKYTKEFDNYKLSDITQKIITLLQNDGKL